MGFFNVHNNQDDFEKRISVQEQRQNQYSKYFVDPPKPTYYKEKRRIPWLAFITVALVAAFMGGIISAYLAPGYLYGKFIPNPYSNLSGLPQNIEIITKGEELAIVPAVVKKAMPSVVGITTVTVQRDVFFGARRGQGIGTGVIIDNRGYILTNSHVVNEGQSAEVKVLLFDGRDLVADVLWNDSMLDLAIVKVDAENLPVATLGNSDEILVGEMAIAIGNPLGLSFERTVTAGIISGLERTIPISQYETIEGLIQTDASINPGNSGGPLLNSKGEVIGINTAKIQTGEGLGFAIPINITKPIVDEFAEKGEFRKAYLGIKGIDVQQYILNYRDDLGVKEGVFVYQVSPDTPVSRAGMEDGDVIVGLNGQKINSMRQLMKHLYKYRPGDTVTVEAIRGGKRQAFKVTLEAVPRG